MFDDFVLSLCSVFIMQNVYAARYHACYWPGNPREFGREAKFLQLPLSSGNSFPGSYDHPYRILVSAMIRVIFV